jgi:hypothetical protein
MEHPIISNHKMDDLGVPTFLETSIWFDDPFILEYELPIVHSWNLAH